MKSSLFTGSLLMAATTLLAAELLDTKLLQGEWVPVKAELGGQAMPDAVLKTIRLKLGEGTYTVSVVGQPDKGTYEIDTSAMPHKMVIKGTEGPNKGRTIPAIYQVTDDTLRICYDLSGTETPKDFKTAPGTRLYLVAYERNATATAGELAEVPFVLGPTRFKEGDRVVIEHVLASSTNITAGDKVLVRGRYELNSEAQAQLCLYLTSSAGAGESDVPTQNTKIDRGSGQFELSQTIRHRGHLHVSFYPAGGGDGFGGVYFGTAAQMEEMKH